MLVAFVMAFGFPPIALWPVSWTAFVILLHPALQKLRSAEALRARSWAAYFFAYSFAVNITGFYWLSYTLKEFGGLPWVGAVPVTAVIFVGFSAFTAVFFGLFAWALQRLRNRFGISFARDTLLLLAGLALWDAGDPRMFPWTPGMSVGSDTLLLASVSVLGTGGWRLLYFAFSVGVTVFWIDARLARKQQILRSLGTFAALFALAYPLGYYQRENLRRRFSQRQPVALVQGNIGNYEKKLTKLGVMPTVRNVMNVHRTLLEKIALHDTEFRRGGSDAENWVVWPETSFPGFPLQPGDMRATLESWTRLVRGVNVVGAYENRPTPFGGRNISLDYNITALFHETQGYVGHAPKMIRIPFGEYIPFDDTFPGLYRLLPAVNHFGAGQDFAPLPHPDPQGPVFVPVVCYEILYAGFVDDYVRAARTRFPGRPLVIVNPTNDSWYGLTSEPFQHSLLARWALARQSLPALRATNTGLSQVIAPWGEVLAQGPQNESTVIFGELPVEKTQRRLVRDESQEVYGN